MHEMAGGKASDFRRYVKNTKDFYYATANCNIVIRKFLKILCGNFFGGTPFFAKFYYVPRHVLPTD